MNLSEAKQKRDAARALMNAAKQGSKKWRDAEEDLDFWVGKVAMLDVMAKRLGGAA